MFNPTGPNELILLLVILAPLLLAAASLLLPSRLWIRITPWVVLPALLAPFSVPAGTSLDLPWLLLGMRFELDVTGGAFLLLSGLIWFLSGIFALSYLDSGHRSEQFFRFFLVTMAGNFGLILARTIPDFYAFFSLMSLASYGLVIHNRDAAAWNAGRIYIYLVVAGEIMLFAALSLIATTTGSLAIPVQDNLSLSSPAIGLIIFGFGIKAALLPLHSWLPLAYTAAPAPASAVLSGAMINAGLIGWLRFLPLGAAPQLEWANLLLSLGMTAAFYGVAVGVTQRNAKTVLAYSSISQMGLIATGIGAGLASPENWGATSAGLVVYALHHGLAKGALFLGEGVSQAADSKRRRWILSALALVALGLAGAPFTAGAIAKIGLKTLTVGLPGAWPALLSIAVPLAAAGTTLLMARFLFIVWSRTDVSRKLSPAAWIAWMLLTAAAATTLFVWPSAISYQQDAMHPAKLLNALWPALLGSLAAAALHLLRRPQLIPQIPAGDILIIYQRASRQLARFGQRVPKPSVSRQLAILADSLQVVGSRAVRFVFKEEGLKNWQIAGSVLLLLACWFMLLLELFQ